MFYYNTEENINVHTVNLYIINNLLVLVDIIITIIIVIMPN